MGKAKRAPESYSFVVDIKSVLAMKPEQRVKWLSKACRKVGDGEANVKHVYDVLSNRKLVADMTEKVGRRMVRVLREHLYLFSEKQQRVLTEDSALATRFTIEDRSEDDDEPDDAARPSTRVDEAAARTEEMMARCRDFVREKAGTFEQRRREAEEAEYRAALARERERQERIAREWEAIHQWHRQLEGWEQACMALCDERLKLHLQQRRERAERGVSSDSSAGRTKRKKEKKEKKEKSRKKQRAASRSPSREPMVDQPEEKRPRGELPTATLADLLRGNQTA